MNSDSFYIIYIIHTFSHTHLPQLLFPWLMAKSKISNFSHKIKHIAIRIEMPKKKKWTHHWNRIQLGRLKTILGIRVQLLNFFWLKTAFYEKKSSWSNIQQPAGNTNEKWIALGECERDLETCRYTTMKWG